MNREEAVEFVSFLKNGKSYATRFQEQEWGLFYEPNLGTFREWGRELDTRTGEINTFDKTLSEAELVERLMTYYNFKKMIEGLRDS